MSEVRQDPKQVAAFRALARRLSDANSEARFEEALRFLMSPSEEEEPAAAPLPHQVPALKRDQALKA
jgi:hypothetical protein